MPCDPLVTALLRDGSRITYPASTDGVMHALEQFSRQDARNWWQYSGYFTELTDVIYDTLFSEPADNVGQLAYWFKKNPKLFKIHAGSTPSATRR